MNDNLPNFAAWQQATLAKFAEDAYKRMQEQQEIIEQLRQDWKDAMVEARKYMMEASK
jgi:hypothetical protein